MAARPVSVVWSPRLQAYNPSDDVERPVRRRLAWELLVTSGLLGRDGVEVTDPPGATDDEIARIHAPAYIRAVKRYSANPVLAHEWVAGQWGFVPGQDTVARPGMHEAAADVCGAAMAGARAVWEGPGRALCPAPAGLHHALSNRAAGFCIYNDSALAVRELLDLGARRVAHIDLDAHHGDGVQWIFYEDPRVLTVSVHEKAPGFFPGTGGLDERGAGDGFGTAVNVPLPPFAGDGPYLAAIDRVVVPAVRDFAPDAIVTHLGADVHHEDPLAHLRVTIDGLERAYAALSELADEVAGGRWLDISGGGYNPMALGRIWALQLGALRGATPPDSLPEEWRESVRGALDAEAPATLREDVPPTLDADRAADGDRVGMDAVVRAAALLGVA